MSGNINSSKVIELQSKAKAMLIEAFTSSGSEALQQVSLLAVANHMRSGGGLPDVGILTMRTGALAREIQSKANVQRVFSGSDSLSWEKPINIAYALVHEKGNASQGGRASTPLIRRAMFRRMKANGMYLRSKANIGNPTNTIVVRARPFLEPALKEVNIKEIIKQKLLEKFPPINEEVIVGR